MRLYPPLFFQRISMRSVSADFREATIVVRKSIFNQNYNGSIFGGTIYSATDPFYAILFDQLLKRRGYKVRIWLKAGEIQYLKPARKKLVFTIRISDEVLNEAIGVLDTSGKFIKHLPIELYDSDGLHCATAVNELYIRNLHLGEEQKVAY